jgi:hypothetical protein
MQRLIPAIRFGSIVAVCLQTTFAYCQEPKESCGCNACPFQHPSLGFASRGFRRDAP